jgi:hypothetical protein
MEWVDLWLQRLDRYELRTVIMPGTAQEAGMWFCFSARVGPKPAMVASFM